MIGSPKQQEFDCPKCRRAVVRPVGAATLHDCNTLIPADYKPGVPFFTNAHDESVKQVTGL